jgi:hypothetical protein
VSVTCPACGGALEFPLDTDALSSGGSDGGERRNTVEAEGIALTLRAPTSRDLMQAAGADLAAIEAALLRACVISAEKEGRAIAVADLPAAVRAAAAEAIVSHEPLTEVLLDLACPDCGHGWPMPFDIAAFFFDEIGQHARRLIGEVALLARRYGWSEQDILAMSPARRQAYLILEGV